MKERLLHILDDTACLTRKQMKDYLAGTMLPEEIHAAESHIASCPLCSMATEGFMEQTEAGLEAIGSLNNNFLKAHFDAITPQVHLNSLSPAAVAGARPKRKAATISLSRLVAAAALVLLAFGGFWLYKYNDGKQSSGAIANNFEADNSTSKGVSLPAENEDLSRPPAAPSTSRAAPLASAPVEKADAPGNEMQQEELAGNTEAPLTEMSSKPAPAPAAAPPPVVAARKYQAPLVVAQAAPAKAAAADASSTTDRDDYASRDELKKGRSLAAGAAASRLEAQSRAKEKEAAADDRVDQLEKGDDNFGAGRYAAALNNYRAEMSSGNASRRSVASLMAARCYLNLGQKAKAQQLLQQLVANGSGPQRRQARRLLRDLDNDE